MQRYSCGIVQAVLIYRYDFPDVLVTDNRPQFAAAEFAVFAKSWMFQHVSRSPLTTNPIGKQRTRLKRKTPLHDLSFISFARFLARIPQQR